eukprot:3285803-Amphidinium_carterae.1
MDGGSSEGTERRLGRCATQGFMGRRPEGQPSTKANKCERDTIMNENEHRKIVKMPSVVTRMTP